MRRPREIREKLIKKEKAAVTDTETKAETEEK